MIVARFACLCLTIIFVAVITPSCDGLPQSIDDKRRATPEHEEFCASHERRRIEQRVGRNAEAYQEQLRVAALEESLGMQLGLAIDRLNHRQLSTYARETCAELGDKYDDPCIHGYYDFSTDECVIKTEKTADCIKIRKRMQFIDRSRGFLKVEYRVPLCKAALQSDDEPVVDIDTTDNNDGATKRTRSKE